MSDEESFSQTIRRAIHDMGMQIHYEPSFLYLHPKDNAMLDIAEIQRASIEQQKQIADAFDLPYWLVGIPGYRAPWKVRWHPRAVRSRVRRRIDKALVKIPGVAIWGPRGSGGWMDPQTPRFGRWWVHVGRYGLGWGEPQW